MEVINPNLKDTFRTVLIAMIYTGIVAFLSRSADAQVTSQQAINTVRAVLNDSLNHEGTYPPWNCEWDENITAMIMCDTVLTTLQLEYLANRGHHYDGLFTGFVMTHEAILSADQQTALACMNIAYRFFNKDLYPDTLSLAVSIKNFIGPIIEVDLAGCVISSTIDQESDAGRIRIMPNPVSARGSCIISFPANAGITGEAGITLFNAAGSKVADLLTQVANNRTEWQVPELETGLYMVLIQTRHHNYSSKIFIFR